MDSDSSYVEDAGNNESPLGQVFPSSPPRQHRPDALDINTSPPASSTASRTVPYVISDNPFAQGEDGKTYFTRPNRFFGAASTWNSWTKVERTVALSLDRVRSQDLSIHLFNAFGLKRKLGQQSGREAKRSKKGKERASSILSTAAECDDERLLGRGNGGRYGLSKSWTAWPMPPDQVPREELLPRTVLEGEYRVKGETRPSANLEEWLIATATRIARERWNARQWEEDLTSAVSLDWDTKVDYGDVDVSAPEDVLDDDDDHQEVAEEAEALHLPETTEEPVFYSQAFSFSDDDQEKGPVSGGEEKRGSDTDDVERRPVPLADDEKARGYFLASARHILRKVDDLLLGLHKARYAYAAKSQSNRRGKNSHSPGDDTSDFSRGRSGSRPALRQKARSSSAYTDLSSASTTSITSRARSRRVENLGLRDWSDVIGMASLTDWDSSVVERASGRCAKLFGETMLFRTFYEGQGKEGSESHFTEQLANDTGSLAPSQMGEQETESNGDEPLAVRTSRPCERCLATKVECRPADGEPGLSRTCRNCRETRSACSGIKVDVVRNERTCPYRTCPRHKVPFRKGWHLQRHINSMHGQTGTGGSGAIERGPGSRNASIGANSAYTDFDADDESNEDSERQILCPVQTCPRAKMPFSKGKRLYEHIRRMHPEVDVDEVKRSESRRRGERRGRWRDERRTRSKSRPGDGSRSQSRHRSRQAGKTREGDDESPSESEDEGWVEEYREDSVNEDDKKGYGC
ncbi:uncharacterized protein Z519_00356 [Cladophialophora bantiana CBS 173.52]|uniref:Rrn9 domain-containing protein n=1 Tax=Cladophialophora bantiana (strain ATCC 10958 / CBS 173.52 / CDC B-1940 / NIH 8579) TaxID=1442370 RepID=A0A0D2I5Z7_CLAB1|nr:uncharacterized protein Z519_00356 [Cladophialophora bantiana CBS 173.52]KIW98695.1 hypothetical protein Z519_00356 [Cladophialophora bantiana CBS 173.52]